jgi:hypothetical protein
VKSGLDDSKVVMRLKPISDICFDCFLFKHMLTKLEHIQTRILRPLGRKNCHLIECDSKRGLTGFIEFLQDTLLLLHFTSYCHRMTSYCSQSRSSLSCSVSSSNSGLSSRADGQLTVTSFSSAVSGPPVTTAVPHYVVSARTV